MMKKLLACMLAGIMLLAGAAVAEQDAALVITATTFPLYEMAQAIGGDHVQVVYAPENPAEAAAQGQLLLCLGGEEDAWADELENVTVLRVTDGMELAENEGVADTDVLTAPVNHMIFATTLADALVTMDADHTAEYQENTLTYTEQMIDLDNRYREAVANVKKVACADGSMYYLAQEYGLEYVSTEDPEAVVLYTYDHPSEEDQAEGYMALMERNLAALSGTAE